MCAVTLLSHMHKHTSNYASHQTTDTHTKIEPCENVRREILKHELHIFSIVFY